MQSGRLGGVIGSEGSNMVTSTFKREKLRARKRWQGRLVKNWFLLFWLFLVFAVFLLHVRSGRYVGMVGVVEKFVTPVAPLVTAKLVSLNVELGQRVKAGDILGELDPSELQADMLIQEAEMADMTASYQRSILQTIADLEANVRDASTQLEVERMNQASAEAELAALKRDLELRKQLQTNRVLSELDAGLFVPQIAALEKTAVTYPSIIARCEEGVERAKRANSELRKWLNLEEGADTLSVMDSVVQRGQTNMALVHEAGRFLRESCLLRASCDGVICRIYYQPGATVDPRMLMPVLEMTSDARPETVVGFLPEVFAAIGCEVGQKAIVYRQSGAPRGGYPAVVEFISPVVEAIPTRLGPITALEVRGRRVTLRVEGEHDLIPGETVRISTSAASWSAIFKSLTSVFRR